MSQNKTNFAVPLAFVGMMFFAIGFALGINSFLIPVLKGALSLPSGVAYLLLAATSFPDFRLPGFCHDCQNRLQKNNGTLVFDFCRCFYFICIIS